MAKIKSSISFKNSILHFEADGRVLIEEITKEDSLIYDLLEELRKFDGVEGVSLSIAKDSDIEPLE